MLSPDKFIDMLEHYEISRYFGVPDSLLKEFCGCLIKRTPISEKHIIAPNEGNAVALASGYHLATGKTALVYMQNSGIGNIVNPVTSLADPQIYAIPVLYLIGWRGAPGEKDEPQHIVQGAKTVNMLELLGIGHTVINGDTTIEDVRRSMEDEAIPELKRGRSFAFIVQSGTFEKTEQPVLSNKHILVREDAIRRILNGLGDSFAFVSTTGKISREMYDAREETAHVHDNDFLTVGSMGQAGLIAMSIAQSAPSKRVCCIDGDGAAIMQMGAFALIGANKPRNMVHVLMNNAAHESVGGQPTVADKISFTQIASACGYQHTLRVSGEQELSGAISFAASHDGLTFIEVMVNLSSRKDLGRPKTSPAQNKECFMRFLGNR